MPLRLRVADRGRGTGVGHRDDHVGLDRRLGGQPLAHPACARRTGPAPSQGGVGPGEVDELEDAQRAGARLDRLPDAGSPLVDHDHLARLQLALDLGADDVERACLGRQNDGIVEPADDQRPDTVRVAEPDHLILAQHHAGEGALASAPSCRRTASSQIALVAPPISRRDHLGVGAVDCEAGRRPRASSLAQHGVLVRLPLWPSAIAPPQVLGTTGCAFPPAVEPVVE